MPRVIRHALYNKVINQNDLRQFREDFALAANLNLEFVDDLGQSPSGAAPLAPMCAKIQRCEAGRRLCQRTCSQLLVAARDQPGCLTCDAGLHEAAVPIRVSGIVVGYLKFAGVASQHFRGADLHRIEHLLTKAGIPLDMLDLTNTLSESRIVSPPLLQAYLRILNIAAQQLALRITAQLVSPPTSLPRIVEQACRVIRRRALTEDIHLEDVARECDVSPSHLSRVFHHAAGMTFREYVASWRAEHALHLLLEGDQSITRIAFESGFQSLSQFNRVFRAIYGKSPRQMRAERRQTQLLASMAAVP